MKIINHSEEELKAASEVLKAIETTTESTEAEKKKQIKEFVLSGNAYINTYRKMIGKTESIILYYEPQEKIYKIEHEIRFGTENKATNSTIELIGSSESFNKIMDEAMEYEINQIFRRAR